VPETVRYEREGDVGVVTLAAPPLNLFGEELTNDLIAALAEAGSDSPRALLIRAEGDVFTGGADVHVFDDKTPEQAQEFFDDLLKITHTLEDMELPTIACVHGLCLTAGLELALACDMIWAGESAKFGLAEKTMKFAQQLAGGPTRAHAATKKMVRAFLDHGVRGADARVGEIAAPLFATEDLQNAVDTFLEHGGPGHATFEGK
jgi:enoyl-CoA hydratase